MQQKTNWGRIFGGFLLLAIIYLVWWALNVGKNAEYGEVGPSVIKPEAYQRDSGEEVASGDALTGDVGTGTDTGSGELLDADAEGDAEEAALPTDAQPTDADEPAAQ